MRSSERPFQLFCGVSIVFLFLAVMLSLSRAGWIGIAIGIAVLFSNLRSIPGAQSLALARQFGRRWVAAGSVILLVLLVVGLILMGAPGRSQVDARLNETLRYETSFLGRVAAWQDSLRMVRDFPVLGVGLGCWPEIFPRYQRPPWSEDFFRETHNDYLQLLTECGIVGFGLLTWFFVGLGARLIRARCALTSEVAPLYAALIAGLGVMAFHEFFDFSLHTTANATLFTVMLGLAVRLALEARRAVIFIRPSRGMVLGAEAIAALLIVAALRQDMLPYPYNVAEPKSVAQAEREISAYPGEAWLHVALYDLLQGKAPAEPRTEQLKAAMWLEPTDPIAHDFYADSLLREGKRVQALAEISRSVANSPDPSTHLNLNERIIPLFHREEQRAVEEGLTQAVAANYDGAVNALGKFYEMVGRPLDRARVYQQAAVREHFEPYRVEDMIQAGLAYAGAKDFASAEHSLRAAIAAVPSETRPYELMVREVFARTHTLGSAQKLVSEGIKAGADPTALYLALGVAAQNAGDRQAAESALKKALEAGPGSYDANLQLAIFYAQQQHQFDLAALYFKKAISIRPDDAQGFGFLGEAEESAYEFGEAQDAFAAATRLEPKNPYYRARYEEIKQRSSQITD